MAVEASGIEATPCGRSCMSRCRQRRRDLPRSRVRLQSATELTTGHLNCVHAVQPSYEITRRCNVESLVRNTHHLLPGRSGAPAAP